MTVWPRALLYMAVVGGGWLVVLPIAILRLEQEHLSIRLRAMPCPMIGGFLIGAGVALALVAGYYLITFGQGTPLPLDPPHQLVTRGPYSRVRNPQAMAMMLMGIGEMALIQSKALFVLPLLTFVYLELLVGPWEDRQLTAMHGERYLAYKRRVRKWLPAFKTFDFRNTQEG